MAFISRRSLLESVIGAVSAILGVLSLTTIFGYLWPKAGGTTRNVLRDLNDQPISAQVLAESNWVIGFAAKGPTIVLRVSKELSAFSAVCTHLGCIVKWLPDTREFFCPCHAGRFDANGTVISGPPPLPLARYKVTTTAEGYLLLEE
jgi:cytochrome b6-f complex iron-sulfur subunit